ncbi:MAG: hypothetical protein K2M82_07365 [Lachnospiraceae bacterium]|nr:hypothetical protein [Lachnospiraceae bacterium]
MFGYMAAQQVAEKGMYHFDEYNGFLKNALMVLSISIEFVLFSEIC